LKFKSPLCPRGNNGNEKTRLYESAPNIFFHVSRPFLNNDFTGRLPVKMKIQKFASRLLSKSAF
jgi:hypothetical protein